MGKFCSQRLGLAAVQASLKYYGCSVISSKQNSSVQLLSKIGSVTEWSQEELMDKIEKVLSSRVGQKL